MKNFQYLILYIEKENGNKKKELIQAGNEKDDY